MDRGRNLEALAEDDEEEEMEEEHRRDSDSESSTSDDDDAPDEGIKRGEPNKFDILCDGVNNSMALVHTALEELLDMKDEMLKHALPPTVLIKLATITGKVFRSISDLNMPVNELLRLVRVYSTPWEEKSAALKKLHEDYEAKQRQLNIAIKRLQLVDAHSKRIAREKRVMNWEKLFAKVMSNKGHGRRWKFLIETIKQKAKLGLEHVQEFTKQLDESSDEEEDEMPTIQLKRQGAETPTSTSDKVSLQSKRKSSKSKKSNMKVPDSVKTNATVKFEGETENEDEEEVPGEGEKAELQSEAGSEVGKVPSIKIEGGAEEEDEEEEEEGEPEGRRSRSSESSKKVRFAADERRKSPIKVETKDAEVWTQEPDYDNYLHVRLYGPVGMKQKELKCSVTYGKQFYKTKQLDDGTTEEPAEQKPSEIKKKSYEEAKFTLPDTVPEGTWQKEKKPEVVQSCQITIHSGTTEAIVAMATINIADLKEVELKTVYLDVPHGDDDVPRSPELSSPDDDLDSLSSDMDIPLPDDGGAKKKEEPVVEEDKVKDVDPMMFPLYSLDGSSSTHKPCGFLPLIMYWAKRARPVTYNRQTGTHGVTELVFEMTGIDLHTTSKEELHKEMVDDATSVFHFTPDVTDRAISAIRFTPEPENPPTSPEQESIPEDISPDIKEEPVVEEIIKPVQEMIPKLEYDKMREKHSTDMLFLQEEYEKRMQSLVSNLQQMEQNQQLHQQQIQTQQQMLQEQQKLMAKRAGSGGNRSPGVTSAPPVTPTKKNVPTEVSKPVIHGPMPPQKPRTSRRRFPVVAPRQVEGIPDEFFDRLQYFEDESYRNKQELVAKTKQQIEGEIEKKLAGQHKLSQKNEEMFEALNDVSLPALFMPFHTGNVFNPRAHQYFHPNGSTDLRLTQPPSVFQLPPLNKSSSVLNLFELSKNFHNKGPGWLMDRYIQQQEPVKNAHGMVPQTSLPTSQFRSAPYTPEPTYDVPSTREAEVRPRMMEAEADC